MPRVLKNFFGTLLYLIRFGTNTRYFEHLYRKGSKSGATSKCTSCEGRGIKVAMRQIGPGMIQRINTVCTSCMY
jgi:DnaJ-class molecular chaperone